MEEKVEEDLVLSKLVSGHRPSLYAVGIAATAALKSCGTAVFMLDVLGRVHVLPSDSVEAKKRPKLKDEDLDVFGEDEAIQLMVKQDEDEETILSYLKRRAARQKGG
jgi:hypothetical protein